MKREREREICFSLFEREHLNTNDDENHHIFCTLLAVWDIIIIIIIIDLIAAPQQEFGNSPPPSLSLSCSSFYLKTFAKKLLA